MKKVYFGQIIIISHIISNKTLIAMILLFIRTALEIDSPQLFSQEFFPVESVQRFQKGVLSRLGTVVANAIASEMSQLQKMG